MTARVKSPMLAAGVVLIVGGGSVLGVAVAAQQHPPQPSPAQAGTIAPVSQRPGTDQHSEIRWTCRSGYCAVAPRTAPGGTPEAHGPVMARSLPVSISIPAIGVRSALLYVGLNPDGTIQVPPLDDPPVTNEAAWYEYSPTPGQPGPAIIEGHVDTASSGPSVFFRLGALRPGDMVDITLADHEVAVFKITAVRLYRKDRFPASVVYGNTATPRSG